MIPVNISDEQPRASACDFQQFDILTNVDTDELQWMKQHNYVILKVLFDFALEVWFSILLSVALDVFVQATQATTRENLSSGFLTKRVSNKSLRLNRLARGRSRDYSSQKADNKVADDTAWMRRLVWTFIATNHRRQVFSVAVQLLYVSFNHDTYKKTRCEI